MASEVFRKGVRQRGTVGCMTYAMPPGAHRGPQADINGRTGVGGWGKKRPYRGCRTLLKISIMQGGCLII